ncbi:MAG: glycosyltransferase [Bdellovibrionales bacterium]|nr:glycosyltransferase [Bdellovibrionales bacterium]
MAPRILYVLHAFHNIAGTEKHTKTLSWSMAPDFESFILAPHGDELVLYAGDAASARREDAGVRARLAYQAPSWPIVSYEAPQTVVALQKVVAAVRPDLIHVQHLHNYPLCALDVLTATGIPVVLSLHDYYLVSPHFTLEGVRDPREAATPEAAERVFGKNIAGYLRQRQEIFARALAKVQMIITPSAYLAHEIGKLYKTRYFVIEHGITPFEAKPLADRAPKSLHFGYIGSLLPQKGWWLLIEAFRKLADELPKVQLDIYGGVAKEKQFQHQRVIYHGVYQSRQLPEIISRIDVGIIPSVFRETYSLTLSELWMGQRPVVASRIGALADRVRDGENGRLFNAGNAEQLLEMMRWFCAESNWREWQIPRPRDVQSMVREYKILYSKIITAQRKQGKGKSSP